nr:MAG: structural protein [Bee densovirus 1]
MCFNENNYGYHGSYFPPVAAATLGAIGNNIRQHATHTIVSGAEQLQQHIISEATRVGNEWFDSGYNHLADFFSSFNPNADQPVDEAAPPAKRQRTDGGGPSGDPEPGPSGTQQQAAPDAPILRNLLTAPQQMAAPAGDVEMQQAPAETAASTAGGGGGFSSGASGGGQQEDGGMPLFPEGRFTGPNRQTKIFTKVFYLKIYANGLLETISEDGQRRVLGWQTVIPYQALSSYMTAEEYLSCIREGSYGKIKEARFQLEFQDIRTPFGANTTDTAEANGNLQFEIQEFRGLEEMMPFQTVITDFPTTDDTKLKSFDNFGPWIKKLYGDQPFSQDIEPRTKTQWPAEMYQRGLDMRPLWQFSPAGTGFKEPGTGILFRDYNQHVTSLPFGKYVTRRVNTNVSKVNGVYFNQIYKPKNGLITAAPTVYDLKREQKKVGRYTRINQPQRMSDKKSINDTPYQDPSQVQYATDWLSQLVQVVTDVQPTISQINGINSVNNTNIWEADGRARRGMATCSYVDDETERRMFVAGVPTDTAPPTCSSANLATHYYRGPEVGSDNPGLRDIYDIAARTVVSSVTQNQYNVVSALNETKGPVNEVFNDSVGYGYANDIDYYTRATLENYSVWTSRNQPPIHAMPSWMIGIVPKTIGPKGGQDDIVNATATFLCKTAIEIELEDAPCVTTNFAFDYDAGRYMDPIIDLARTQNEIGRYLYGGKWRHNERDVFIREPKLWAMDYARAAKMGFVDYPKTQPTL